MVTLLLAIIVAAGMVVLLRPWPFFLTREHSHPLNERNLAAEFAELCQREPLAFFVGLFLVITVNKLIQADLFSVSPYRSRESLIA